jgi:hypothetical protein
VDVFTRFLPERAARDRLGQELAYTMNLTKEQTAFLATTYKPAISLTPTSLQVGTILSVLENPLSSCALCCGSGSAPGFGSAWIRIILVTWISIMIRIK